MAIKFVCSCGKRLRARDEMSRRRSVCPRCGKPVGIPSTEPIQEGEILGPMTPAQRVAAQMRLIREREGTLNPLPSSSKLRRAVEIIPSMEREPILAAEPIGAPAPVPIDLDAVRQVRGVKIVAVRRDLASELRWHRSLLYAIRAIPMIAGLALLWSLLLGVISFAVPELMATQFSPEHVIPLALCAPCVLLPLVLFGYTAALPSHALISAAEGRLFNSSWPGKALKPAMLSAVLWLVAFVAGPAVPAYVAYDFWLHCGDPTWIDWLIMAELGTVAIAYWVLVVVSVSRLGGLKHANPASVGTTFEHFQPLEVVALLLGATVLLVHLVAVVLGLHFMHSSDLRGALVLYAGCLGGLFWCTFVFRQLGVWCYRLRIPLLPRDTDPVEEALPAA